MLHRKSQGHALSVAFDIGPRANGLSQLTQSSPKVSAAPADDVHCLLSLRQNPEAVAIRFQVVDSCRVSRTFASYFSKSSDVNVLSSLRKTCEFARY